MYSVSSSKKGFTLVEMLVYLAVLIILAGGALTLVFLLGEQFAQLRTDQLVTKSAQATLENMLYTVRTSDTVSLAYTTLQTNPGALYLIQGTTTHQYALVGGRVVYTKNAIAQGPLTSDRVRVDELRFFAYDNANTQMVRIELSLTAVLANATTTKTFSSSATLRGSYD